MPTQSIWMAGSSGQYEQLKGEARADVAVVGAGVAGLTAAYLLSAAGVGVSVVEAREVGGGASGHTAAFLTSQHGLCYAGLAKRVGTERAALIARANEEAVHLAAGIVEAEELSCGFALQDSHAFTCDPKREGELETEAEAASKLGITADITSSEPFLFPYTAAVRFRGQASLHPVEYMRGLARAVTRSGGRIYERSRAVEIPGNTVVTQEGRLRARCVVVATDFPFVNIPGWYSLKMLRRRNCCSALTGIEPPAGLWISCDRGGYAYRGAEDRLIVSRGGHDAGRESDAGCHEAMRRDMLAQFPGAALTALWSAQYADTVDGLPYVGKYSRKTGCMFVSAGFGRWGLSQATLAGRLISDGILDRKNPYAELYSPQRHLSAAAWGRAASSGAASAWRLATSAFRPKAPACSHYGCRTAWNSDDKTWDCPCHGSRFDEDGNVLDAPAVRPVRK